MTVEKSGKSNVHKRPSVEGAKTAGAGIGTAPRPSKGKPSGSSKPNGSLKPKGGSRRTVLIVAGVVVAALVLWLLIWLFACNGRGIFDPNAQTGQAPYKTEEEKQAELDRIVEEGMFNISIASAIQFEDGTSSGTAYIENVPNNNYDMKVTITDDVTGDVLYESGVLQPNQFIENITLTKDLDPGSYSATATFTALDKGTHEERGKAAAKVTINVLG
ncbi:flagellar protein FliS [Adlercreutzia sp. ZJ304]|uniref:flagellar protein FliS n=1 Tax=Adlercreutzia sp. ZJ304 TaxID=2709791 RepID=UPI0013ED089F|nr:flagellar protein FliS [Adlercreutzia sp. ZJ304]